MAVANWTEFSNTDPCFIRTTDQCFYCGEHLTGQEWIYWQGCDEKNQQIWLHPACAKRLADHLTKDYALTT